MDMNRRVTLEEALQMITATRTGLEDELSDIDEESDNSEVDNEELANRILNWGKGGEENLILVKNKDRNSAYAVPSTAQKLRARVELSTLGMVNPQESAQIAV
ncbi:hypothetical protein FQA39_LY03378 [Lamprigera yunnana]|nr:hypothetical protein FQA39_LY03378 [Lamprigera yunnana]